LSPSCRQDIYLPKSLAGTLVVWDVDPLAETVTCYRSESPTAAGIFRRGDVADGEPALPGGLRALDDNFPR
jgi:hypothetical protein